MVVDIILRAGGREEMGGTIRRGFGLLRTGQISLMDSVIALQRLDDRAALDRRNVAGTA